MADTHTDLLGEAEFAPLAAEPPVRVAGRTVVILPPDPSQMAEKALKLYTQNRIRQCFHALTLQNLGWVQEQLHAVARDSPARALELFIDLAKFSLPQLKETSVNVTQNGASRQYTIAELEAELAKPE